MSFSQEGQLEPKDVDKLIQKSSGLETYARLTGLGFEILAYVLLALGVNKWLETKMDTKGLSLALLVFLAMGLWIYRVINTLSDLEKKKLKNAKKTDKN